MGTAEARARFHELLTSETYSYVNAVAPVFDGLSARIAQAMGWEHVVLAGSKMKAINFGLPDEIDNLVTISDKAEAVREVRRCATDVVIILDVDDAGGSPLSAARLIRMLEGAGVTAVELEDRKYPNRFVNGGDFFADRDAPPDEWPGSQGYLFHSVDHYCAILKAALDAREDPNTVVFARPAVFSETLVGGYVMDRDEALERVRTYAQTGVQGIMVPGEAKHIRRDIEDIHSVTDLPQMILRMPPDVVNDKDFLRRNNVRIRRVGQPTVHMAGDALYASLSLLKAGGDGIDPRVAELNARAHVPDYTQMLEFVSRTAEFAAFEAACYA